MLGLIVKIKNWILNNHAFILLVKLRSWVKNSVLGFAIVFLFGFCNVTLWRYLYLRVFELDSYLPAFYLSVKLSFAITILLITVNFLNKKGYFTRSLLNKEKWVEYEAVVSESHGLKNNFLWKNIGSKILLFFLLPVCAVAHSGPLYFLLSFYSLFYLCNIFYIVYHIRKTPSPKHLLQQPPQVFSRIVNSYPLNKVFFRGYSTNKTERVVVVWNNNYHWIKTCSWVMGGSAAILWGCDQTYSEFTGNTTLSTRYFDWGYRRWFTNSKLVRERMMFLEEHGIDSSDLINPDGRLSSQKVLSRYREYEQDTVRTIVKEQLGLLNKESEIK